MYRRRISSLVSLLAVCMVALLSSSSVSASVFLPCNVKTRSLASPSVYRRQRSDVFGARKRRHGRNVVTAMAIPGNGVMEQVFVGGFGNFLQIYNVVITVRILLSWFPQAQGIGALQPVFAITDPFLNIFRGVIPPIGGLDLSPIAAFFLLNVVTNATAAVGSDIPPHIRKKLELQKKYIFGGRSAASHRPFGMQ